MLLQTHFVAFSGWRQECLDEGKLDYAVRVTLDKNGPKLRRAAGNIYIFSGDIVLSQHSHSVETCQW